MDAVIFRNGAGDDLCPGLPPGRMRAGQGGHPKKRKGPDPLVLGLFFVAEQVGPGRSGFLLERAKVGFVLGEPCSSKTPGILHKGKAPPSKEGAKYVKQLGCLRLQAVAKILRKSKPPSFEGGG